MRSTLMGVVTAVAVFGITESCMADIYQIYSPADSQLYTTNSNVLSNGDVYQGANPHAGVELVIRLVSHTGATMEEIEVTTDSQGKWNELIAKPSDQ